VTSPTSPIPPAAPTPASPATSAEPEIAELELRTYLRILGRRKRMIVLSTLAVVGASLLWSFLTEPTYEARARVLVQPRERSSLFEPSRLPPSDPNRAVQNEILVFDSPQLKARVRERLGAAPTVVALQVSQTDVIEVLARSSQARRAAEVANTYARAYIDLRREQAVEDVVSAAGQLQAKISDLQRQIETAASVEQQNALIDQQALFRRKLDELQVDNALSQGGARLISDARIPGSPESPDPVRTGVVSLAFYAFRSWDWSR
jgi:uncharacterized protein involved in exopolysaccharide biosynthesis